MSTNGGQNELNKLSVSWKEISDTVVCKHELVHAHLLHNSIYGSYQLQIKDVYDENSESLYIKRIQFELYRNSNHVHECVATYCSIKQLTSDIALEYETILSDEYRVYYNTLSSNIDENLQGSFLQYLLGFRIGTVCLGVDIYEQAKNIITGKNRKLDSSLGPNLRLKLLLESMNSDFYLGLNLSIDECVKALKRKRIVPDFFDSRNDETWELLGLEEISKVNDALSNAMWDFMSNNVECIEVVGRNDFENYYEITIEFMKFLEEEFKVQIARKNDIDNFKINNIEMVIEDYFTVKYINSSYIDNIPRTKYSGEISKERIPIFNFKKFIVLDEKSYIHYKPIYDRNDKSQFWYMIKSRESDYEIAGSCLNYELLMEQDTTEDLFVIGIKALSYKNNFIDVDNIINDFKRNIAKSSLMHLNHVFYMHGDYSFWMNYLQSKGRKKVITMVFNDENATQLDILSKDSNPSDDKRDYFGMLILHSTEITGIFIRCFNRIMFNYVQLLLTRLLDKEVFEIDESKDRKTVEKYAIQAFKAIESVWSIY